MPTDASRRESIGVDRRRAAEVELDDGRVLSYGDFGDPDGSPVLFFHGTPGSHAEAVLLHEAAEEHGVRLVAPDRPGMGTSSPRPDRTLLDWVDDVVALADLLDIDRLRVIGYSGGGPYALACGFRLPGRVDALVVVSGSAPMDRPDSLHRSALIDRLLVRSSLRSSGVTRLGIGAMALGARIVPGVAVRLAEPQLTPRERAALGTLFDRPAREELAGFLEAVEQGSGGPALDYRVTALPWGFLPEEVSVPVTWWHGVDDDVVPLHQAQDVVARLPDVRFRRVPDASHLAIRVEAAAIVESATVA